MLLRKPLISRVFSATGLLLWLFVVGAQSVHEWTHHVAHQTSVEEHQPHCAHHHTQESIIPLEGVSLRAYDECAICDWDWLPAGSIGAKALQVPSRNWSELLKVGTVERGYFRNHWNQAKSHRGPPQKG